MGVRLQSLFKDVKYDHLLTGWLNCATYNSVPVQAAGFMKPKYMPFIVCKEISDFEIFDVIKDDIALDIPFFSLTIWFQAVLLNKPFRD